MAGIKKLRKIQLGREGTAGTAVDATTVWRGTGTIEDRREVIFPEEDVGYKSSLNRSYIPKVEAALELDETPATFEQVIHLLEMGIETATASQDGSGSGYIYNYPFATTTDTATVKSYTVEGGDNTQEEEFAYGYCESFTLSGGFGEALMMSGTIIGRESDSGTYTSTTVPTAVEEILFQKGKLYIDAIGGTIGDTQVTSTFRDMALNVETGWRTAYTGDGELYFTFLKNVGPEITLDITFEHDSNVVTEKANWRAQTARLIRVAFEGSTFTTAGTSYSVKTLYIDLAGKWESFEKIGDADGNNVVTGTFRAAYDTTAATFADIKVVNALAAAE